MNLKNHNGTVTGDDFAKTMTYCDLDPRHDASGIRFAVAPLDAPHWLPTGRMCALPERRHHFNPDPLPAVQFQEQTSRP